MIRSLRLQILLLVAFVPLLCSAQLRRGEATVVYQLREGVYYASVNRAGWSAPKSVRLCSERDIEALPLNHTLYEVGPSKKAYSLIMAPLESLLKKGDKIYYVPTGKLHFINLDALSDLKGVRLFEKYGFYRVSNTTDLPEREKTTRITP